MMRDRIEEKEQNLVIQIVDNIPFQKSYCVFVVNSKLVNLLSNLNKKMLLEVCVIPSPVVTQAVASSGVDAIVIDQEHGAISTDKLHSMIASTAGTDCAPLVRVAEKRPEYVKIALDMGAEGIMFPLIHNAQEAKE